jgi:hypothetical protein
MRPRQYVIAATILCFATTPLFAQKQIQLLATITDPSGAEIASLAPSDIKVSENGTDLTVSNVQTVRRTPKLQILIDNGIGMQSSSLGDLRKAMKDLIATLPEGLEVAIVTTAPQPRFLERPTTDRAKLVSAVDRLAPDTGAGRFVESLAEAADRADKDKDPDASYTVLSVATTSGDTDVRDGDVKRLFERVQRKHVTVYVVLLNAATNSSSGGAVQTDVGQQVAKGSGGTFQTIAVPNRLVTLLPELGKQMGASLGPGAKQFRITVERPNGGALGQIGLGVSGGRKPTSVALDQSTK